MYKRQIRHGIKKAENAWKYWASKATVMYTVSTLAAIVMVTALDVYKRQE